VSPMLSGSRGKRRAERLKREIIELGPWHHDVQVTTEISTAVSLEAHPNIAAFSNVYRPRFRRLVEAVFPGTGLSGLSFLDCACNCGAYCFWAKELGAEECFGFDARQHWIDQAEFLLRNREQSDDAIRFVRSDLYEVPNLDLPRFDVTLFKGIFYHLPDPVAGLKIAADLTSELLMFDSAAQFGDKDGFLAIATENVENLMSGIHGLNWFPTGPEVVKGILRWMGFREFRVLQQERSAKQPSRGRLGLLAARTDGFFEAFDRASKGDVRL
jgi:tRNA (mo5U34)-methyltransferase